MMAQNDSDTISQVFELGEVSVSRKVDYEPVISRSREELIRHSNNNLSESLQELPGIIVGRGGARNESTIFIRGFDSRQISLLIDGVPVYSNYDGNIDISRFLSWNYEKITISKGFTSLLYGPNTMGGAINLITSKPMNPFEIDVYSGLKFGRNGYNGIVENLRLGGKSGNLFYLGGLSYHNLKSWSLSKSYQDENNLDDGTRDNSYELDLNGNLRLGYSIDENNEYVLTYNRMDGEKGIPVYEGDIQSPRYWQMPDWNKESLYFSSKTAIGKNSSLISRLYIDKFYNLLESYDDSSYSTQTFRYAFNSIYDDKTYGANLNYSFSGIDNNDVSIATQFKRDIHTEQSGTDLPFLNFSDNIFSVAIEDAYKINKSLNLIGGVSWNLKSNTGAEEYFTNEDSIAKMVSGSDRAMNYRLGAFLLPSIYHKISLSYSANSRFSTLKERYSYRLGRSLPNPDLGAERANHLILGYSFNNSLIFLNTEIFHINSKSKIAYTNVDPNTIQYQNIEKSHSYGTDFQLGISLKAGHKFRLNYSYLYIENPDDPEFKFIDIPNHNLGMSLEIIIKEKALFNFQYSFISDRYSYTDGSFYTGGYGLLDAGLNVELNSSLSLQLAVNNLLDKEYFYSEGYPAEGINARLGVRFTFEK